MRYNLKNDSQSKEASTFLASCILRGKTVELKVVRANRSLQANAYYHLLLQICASEWGYSLQEMKIIHKRDISPSVFIYYKNDRPFTKSSADLDSKQLSDAIEQLKKYSAEQGLVLPEPNDEEKLRYYERKIQNDSRYL
jgi:hypothetical protein